MPKRSSIEAVEGVVGKRIRKEPGGYASGDADAGTRSASPSSDRSSGDGDGNEEPSQRADGDGRAGDEGEEDESAWKNWEFLDHTADVQIHSWGGDLATAIQGAVLAIFDYITPLEGVEIDPDLDNEVSAEGHDLESMLFCFLDECLSRFHCEKFVAVECKVTVDETGWKAKCRLRGETFSLDKHLPGTEVKAITYSNMQVIRDEVKKRVDIYVIVDI